MDGMRPALLEALMSHCTNQERRVLLLKYHDELKDTEIAAAMRLSLAEIESLHKAAMAKLKAA